jgi:hypothetical protein
MGVLLPIFSYRARKWNARSDCTLRIDRLKPRTCVLPAEAVEGPPQLAVKQLMESMGRQCLAVAMTCQNPCGLAFDSVARNYANVSMLQSPRG